MKNVTEKTRQLVDVWVAAQRRMDARQDELYVAAHALTEAGSELAKWLILSEAIADEWFNIWFGDGIVRARRIAGKYEVEWLKQPGLKMAAEIG